MHPLYASPVISAPFSFTLAASRKKSKEKQFVATTDQMHRLHSLFTEARHLHHQLLAKIMENNTKNGSGYSLRVGDIGKGTLREEREASIIHNAKA